MKRVGMLAGAVVLLTSWAAAQNPAARYQYVLLVSVKPGMTEQYESYVGKPGSSARARRPSKAAARRSVLTSPTSAQEPLPHRSLPITSSPGTRSFPST